MSWAKVYELFDELPKSEQLQLFQAMQTTLFPESKEDIAAMVSDIREVRFSKGRACVHCGSVSVKRNGKYRSRQRYLCNDCGKSFNDMTASPLSGTHYPHKWLKYFKLMLEGVSLPKISDELDIHVATAFYWRHKILNALRSRGYNTLTGIIESDETYFLESVKGIRNLTHRRPRKRGGVARQRGISNEQISVLVAHDHSGNILSKTAGRGRITADEIDSVLSACLDSDVVLCTDSATNFKLYAKKKAIPHEVLNGNKGERVKKGIYHIQHVNAYHQRLKKWIQRFNGVATRYMDNYLFWFRFLEMNKHMSRNAKKRSIVLEACRKAVFSPVWSFKSA